MLSLTGDNATFFWFSVLDFRSPSFIRMKTIMAERKQRIRCLFLSLQFELDGDRATKSSPQQASGRWSKSSTAAHSITSVAARRTNPGDITAASTPNQCVPGGALGQPPQRVHSKHFQQARLNNAVAFAVNNTLFAITSELDSQCDKVWHEFGDFLTKNNTATMEGKRPSFFKFFMAEHSSERMRIPPAFLAYIKGKRPRAVSLTGPSGDSWTVGLIKEEGALYFDGGWPEFVEDHSVQTGDFLVFQYDGEAGFQVRVFDPTMSPREASFLAWNSVRVATELIRSNGVMHVKRESDADGATGYSGTDRFCFQITMKSYNVKKAIFFVLRASYLVAERSCGCCAEPARRKQWPVWMFRRKDIRRRESWYLSKGLPAFIRDNQKGKGKFLRASWSAPARHFRVQKWRGHAGNAEAGKRRSTGPISIPYISASSFMVTTFISSLPYPKNLPRI
ncbi:hypothetical protein NL676_025039 [Syzygium grande]|nr:hypothetical protein NL676_025039 [Syzygium grande]